MPFLEAVALDPAQLALIFFALGLGSLAKGVTGIGLPLIAVPLLAAFIGVEHAVVLMVVPGLVSNGWLLWVHRGAAPPFAKLRAFMFFGVLGGIAGTWLLAVASRRLARGLSVRARVPPRLPAVTPARRRAAPGLSRRRGPGVDRHLGTADRALSQRHRAGEGGVRLCGCPGLHAARGRPACRRGVLGASQRAALRRGRHRPPSGRDLPAAGDSHRPLDERPRIPGRTSGGAGAARAAAAL